MLPEDLLWGERRGTIGAGPHGPLLVPQPRTCRLAGTSQSVQGQFPVSCSISTGVRQDLNHGADPGNRRRPSSAAVATSVPGRQRPSRKAHVACSARGPSRHEWPLISGTRLCAECPTIKDPAGIVTSLAGIPGQLHGKLARTRPAAEPHPPMVRGRSTCRGASDEVGRGPRSGVVPR